MILHNIQCRRERIYFCFLCINKCEWSNAIKKEEDSLASFMACVEESIKERDNEFEKGLDSKVT